MDHSGTGERFTEGRAAFYNRFPFSEGLIKKSLTSAYDNLSAKALEQNGNIKPANPFKMYILNYSA